MINTRTRGAKTAVALALGFLVAGMSATAASAAPADIPTVEPTVDPLCGPNNDAVTTAAIEGVTYSDTGWVAGERTITATADEGYVLDGQSEWTFTDEATLCPFEYIESDATPSAPTVVPLCGPNNDVVKIPVTEGVIYAGGAWVDGKRAVTATADEGYDLALGADAEWTITDLPVAGCPDEGAVFSHTPTGELAYTGATSATGGLAALSALLVAAGAALVARKVRVQS
jgi:hypothetical protein